MTTPGHPLLPLGPDELLTTTRSVRKRLDLTRPVERSVIEECLRIAQQAPSASNRQHWHFVVVTDPAKRAALTEVYRKGRDAMVQRRLAAAASERRAGQSRRSTTSGDHFADHLADVPVHVIPCIEGRAETQPFGQQAALWGTIIPAAWSFMLAARARGLGTVLTTLHLAHEHEAAEILGIPYDERDAGGADPTGVHPRHGLQAGPRDPLDTMVHWDSW